MASCYYYIHLETDIQRVASYPQIRRADDGRLLQPSILFSTEYSLGISESARQRLHILGTLVVLDRKRSEQISHKTFCKADIVE